MQDAGAWQDWNIARDFKLCPTDNNKGYVLDGYGGLHAVGSAPTVAAGTYDYPGWDIMRSIAIAPDCQSGYVLDGWGAVHRFASNRVLPPAITGNQPPYWQGWDIAKAIVLDLESGCSSGGCGYTLDGYGGLTQWGQAPAINPQPAYHNGWDIARAVVISTFTPCCSGYTVDGFGGFSGFGANAPAIYQPPYYPGFDVIRGLTMSQQLFWQSPPYKSNGYYADLYIQMTTYMSTNCC
jgi:hypothetical protein